jgi:hypothetical protein
MTDLSRRLLAYALGGVVFLLVPPLLHGQIGPTRGFTLQEAADLLTPLVVIPLAWWALDATGQMRGRVLLAFLAIAAVWIEAHGIHLGANAIGDAFSTGPERDAFYATAAGELDHWLDEVLSHWLWHLAWVALDVLMLVVATRRHEAAAAIETRVATLAGAIHGAVFFFVTTEGATFALGIPASFILVLWTGRERLGGSRHPIVVFLFASALATLFAYIIWAVRYGWPLVEPCTVVHC